MTKKLSIVTFMIINGLLAFMMIVTLMECQDANLTGNNPITTSNTFYLLQLGQTSPVYSIVMLCVLTICGSFLFVYMKNNAMFYSLISRIGYRRFLKKGLIASFCTGAGLALVMFFYHLITLTLFIRPLSVTPIQSYIADTIAFFDDGNLWSTVQFCTLSALGWGVYAIFVFSINLWIKKTPLAIGAGSLVGVVLFMVPALMAQVLNGFLAGLFYTFQLSTLLVPGTVTYRVIPLDHTVSYFPYSVAIYLGLAMLSMYLWKKQKEQSV
ncbi:hypothetical protein [Convivina intestini]|uniref:Uncharacterized protein n=1 Tax=Convivina intestini TaxID=1505726 RepID=A0A2U1DBM3_9LACO|nr:hypothetical protein [Convivina intestini]PVY85068.1 hypothetical protein C7384_10393 [Convivina intestini]CAH1853592.1 hypothetical protein R077811_00745 [Convivina intestini]SDB88927.1 hypothetical protein SAMN05216341_10361 [Leuconostocaceae bacterium R-53105]